MNGVFDSLSGAIDLYTRYEETKRGFELQDAAMQQERLQDAIAVEQQTQPAHMQQAFGGGNGSMTTYALLGLGGVAILLLALKR